MNQQKQLETIRKRNAALNQRLEDAVFELDYTKALNTEGYKQAKNLIQELSELRGEWLSQIEELKKKSEEYDAVIAEATELKKMMNDMGVRIPFYKKIYRKICHGMKLPQMR